MKKIQKNDNLNLSFQEGPNSVMKSNQFDHFSDDMEKNNLVLFPDDVTNKNTNPDQKDLLDFDIGETKSKSHMNLMGRTSNLISTFNLNEFELDNKSKSNVKLPHHNRISLKVDPGKRITYSECTQKKFNKF
jgi:hypothetical protein